MRTANVYITYLETELIGNLKNPPKKCGDYFTEHVNNIKKPGKVLRKLFNVKKILWKLHN